MKIRVKYLMVLLFIICQVGIVSEVLGNSIEEKQQLDNLKITFEKFKKESESSNLITPNNILIPEIAKIIEYSLKNNINFLSKAVDHTSEKDKEGNISKLITKELLEIMESFIGNSRKSNYVCLLSSENKKKDAELSKFLDLYKIQDIVHFLVKYQLASDKPSFKQSIILGFFYSLEYYSEDSKKIIKKLLFKNDFKSPGFLYLLDASGLYKDKEVMAYLQKQAKLCNSLKRDKKWVSLLLMAKYQNKKAIEKLTRLAQGFLKKTKPTYDEIYYLSYDLAVVPNEKITAVLRDFLYSKSEYKFAKINYNFSKRAALALDVSVKGLSSWIDENNIKLENLSIYPERWLSPQEIKVFILILFQL